MLAVSSRAFRAGEGTPVETPPAPEPTKPDGVKPCGFMRLAQKSPYANPLKLSHVVSQTYVRKRAIFESEDGSTSCSPRKPNTLDQPKPSEPGEVKPFGIRDLGPRRSPPNPLQLSLLISEAYILKMAVFREKDGYGALLAYARWRLAACKPTKARRHGRSRNFGTSRGLSTSISWAKASNLWRGLQARRLTARES